MTKLQHTYCIAALLLLAGILTTQIHIYIELESVSSDVRSIEISTISESNLSYDLNEINRTLDEIFRQLCRYR